MEPGGKTAVVTGASRGIGRALALALASEGCNLLLTALEGDELAATAESARQEDVAVEALAVDLTDPLSFRAFLAWLEERRDTIDILVNNAGAGRFGPFAASEAAGIAATLALNAEVPTLVTHALLPALHRRPEALIVNISSAVATLPYPGLAVYGATKGYLSAFSASLQCELAGSNVRLLCFHPGFTATSFMDAAGMDLSRVPRFLVSTPEATAGRIVKAMRGNRARAWGDGFGRLGAALAGALPHAVVQRIFGNLFWEAPRS